MSGSQDPKKLPASNSELERSPSVLSEFSDPSVVQPNLVSAVSPSSALRNETIPDSRLTSLPTMFGDVPLREVDSADNSKMEQALRPIIKFLSGFCVSILEKCVERISAGYAVSEKDVRSMLMSPNAIESCRNETPTESIETIQPAKDSIEYEESAITVAPNGAEKHQDERDKVFKTCQPNAEIKIDSNPREPPRLRSPPRLGRHFLNVPDHDWKSSSDDDKESSEDDAWDEIVKEYKRDPAFDNRKKREDGWVPTIPDPIPRHWFEWPDSDSEYDDEESDTSSLSSSNKPENPANISKQSSPAGVEFSSSDDDQYSDDELESDEYNYSDDEQFSDDEQDSDDVDRSSNFSDEYGDGVADEVDQMESDQNGQPVIKQSDDVIIDVHDSPLHRMDSSTPRVSEAFYTSENGENLGGVNRFGAFVQEEHLDENQVHSNTAAASQNVTALTFESVEQHAEDNSQTRKDFANDDVTNSGIALISELPNPTDQTGDNVVLTDSHIPQIAASSQSDHVRIPEHEPETSPNQTFNTLDHEKMETNSEEVRLGVVAVDESTSKIDVSTVIETARVEEQDIDDFGIIEDPVIDYISIEEAPLNHAYLSQIEVRIAPPNDDEVDMVYQGQQIEVEKPPRHGDKLNDGCCAPETTPNQVPEFTESTTAADTPAKDSDAVDTMELPKLAAKKRSYAQISKDDVVEEEKDSPLSKVKAIASTNVAEITLCENEPFGDEDPPQHVGDLDDRLRPETSDVTFNTLDHGKMETNSQEVRLGVVAEEAKIDESQVHFRIAVVAENESAPVEEQAVGDSSQG